MKKIVFCMISLLFVFPISIEAYECSGEDKERLQALSNNISITLEEQDDGNIGVVFAGVSKSLRILNPQNWMYYRNVSENEIGEVKISDLKQGTTYRFEISSASSVCLMEKFRTITINVPSINPYYNDKVCDNAKEYSLCQKWTTVSISYDEFVKKVNDYISSSNNSDTNIKENTIDKKFDFFTFYEKYYLVTFIGLICTLGILIFLWIKENKKNKL